MTDISPQSDKSKSNLWRRLLIGFVCGVVACVVFVRMRPLVFNESALSHAHCIKQIGLSFYTYAQDHGGKFPFHTNGYGDALLLLIRDYGDHPATATGPGYDHAVFAGALTNHTDIPEVECGRVYVQGLAESDNPDIALLFDKLPSPGGDHCHLLRRLWTPLGREVWTLGGGHTFIKETDWPHFSKQQKDLLVAEGFDRSTVEALYAEKGRRH